MENKTQQKFTVGDYVTCLMRPTAVVVGFSEANEPIIEAWGYGRFLGPINPEFIAFEPFLNDMNPKEARRWFKVAIDSYVGRYGEESRPQSHVAKSIYDKAVEDAADALDKKEEKDEQVLHDEAA